MGREWTVGGSVSLVAFVAAALAPVATTPYHPWLLALAIGMWAFALALAAYGEKAALAAILLMAVGGAAHAAVAWSQRRGDATSLTVDASSLVVELVTAVSLARELRARKGRVRWSTFAWLALPMVVLVALDLTQL
jgi:hypothetical protein